MNLELPIRILTHNIRYSASPSQRFPNEKPWSERLPGIVAELKYHTRTYNNSNSGGAAFICLQEVLHEQLVDILHSLNNNSSSSAEGEEGEWTYFGVGRDDGVEAGEYSPIFYRRSKGWRKIHAETKWLSPTPDVKGSKGWDAGSVRIVTVVIFELGEGDGDGDGVEVEEEKQRNNADEVVNQNQDQDRDWISVPRPPEQPHPQSQTQTSPIQESHPTPTPTPRERTRSPPRRRLLLLNTHLDNQGLTSRIESAKLILGLIPHYRQAWSRIDAVVLAGDLNSEAPGEREGGATTSQNPEEGSGGAAQDAYSILSSSLRDLRTLVPPKQRYGNSATYTGFDGKGDGNYGGRGARIDFIFVDNPRAADGDEGEEDGSTEMGEGCLKCQVEGYAVLPNVFDDGIYISDHRCVVGDLVLR